MLDARFQIAPALQQVFRNKDTGLPLSNGQVYFYEDKQRTVLKPVYELTGAPPNYTYTPLPNPLALNSVGAFETAVYYFPFAANGDIDLYFIEVLDALKPTGIVQLTREAYPNFIDNEPDLSTEEATFVPNPQFLSHNDLRAVPNDPAKQAGQVRAGVTDVAYGGWTFERPDASTARDFITFPRFGSFGTVPEGDPRYEIDIQCQLPDAGDLRKDLCLKFNNVNRFASLTNMLTYGFTARSNSGSNEDIDLILLKNFGTGGSATAEIAITTFTFTPIYQQFFFSFVFGDNSATTLGLQDDDFIQLILRLPVDTISNISCTSFFLFDGAIMNPTYPLTTNSQMDYRSLAGFLEIPKFNNTDWYLPLRLTPEGLEFDNTEIGKIYISSKIEAERGELKCDGAQYLTGDSSADLIPFSRLQAKWFTVTTSGGVQNEFPLYGTGGDYITQWRVIGSSDQAFLFPNAEVSLLNLTAGTTSFVVTQIGTGIDRGVTSFSVINGVEFSVLAKQNGAVTEQVDVRTSGFSGNSVCPGSPATRVQFFLETTAAAGLAGLFYTFEIPGNLFYVWFQVNGVGVDPGFAATPILVSLLSTDTNLDVSVLNALVLGGRDVWRITYLDAASITAGEFFTFDSTLGNFYVWYSIDGVGVDPNVIGRLGIEVAILGVDLAADVNLKTQVVINSYAFQTPDLRGLFIRGLNTDGNTGNDPDNSLRHHEGIITQSDFVLPGGVEWDNNKQHQHNIVTASGGAAIAFVPTAGTLDPVDGNNTEDTGRFDSHPRNISFLYVVKY